MKLSRFGFYVLGTLGIVAILATAVNVLNWRTEMLYGAGSTQTASSTVIVGNAAPTVTSVSVNAGSAITLTANATTAVSVYALISDNNGCTDITSGTSTILLYRSGVTSSTCLTTANNLNCYRATAFTATSSCSGNQMGATTTFGVYYFADPTDASSTEYGSQNWTATVIFKDANNTTGSGDPLSGVELNSLTALNVTTSSINYGTLSASSTSATNEVTTSTNAGNTSSTISLSANNTLTSSNDSIATTSQHYATSTFTWNSAGPEQQLQPTATHVPGSIMTKPTSTTNVNREIFWALNVPAGKATGTYSGQTLFTARYVTSSPL